MDTTCYDKIVGLSSSDCPCLDPKPLDASVSRSGLFIADLAPLDQLDYLSPNCTTGTAWDILTRARESAIMMFIADSNAMLASRFQSKRPVFSGHIGEAAGQRILQIPTPYAGVRVACQPIRSGKMRVNAIGGVFSQTGQISVQCYSKNGDLVGNPVALNTVANKHVSTPCNLLLPLYVPYTNRPEYFFVYETVPANMPKSNNLTCGCGGFNPGFDYQSPSWGRQEIGSRAWANWVMVGGWQGTVLEVSGCPESAPKVLNGLTLSIECFCSVSELLCAGAEMNFDSNPVSMSIAFAIQYKSAEIAAEKILRSSEMNRQNMINRDSLTSAISDWRAKYTEHINYIVATANADTNDCLTCKSSTRMSLKTIYT